ncbi:MAG: DUF4295 family protein [Bacteroidia bacterium]|nr:DUF4295 family protein [Bacteroidia bacterium]
MAKKAVAGFRDPSKTKQFTKVLIPVKNEKTGAYGYKEEIVPTDGVQQYLKDNVK